MESEYGMGSWLSSKGIQEQAFSTKFLPFHVLNFLHQKLLSGVFHELHVGSSALLEAKVDDCLVA